MARRFEYLGDVEAFIAAVEHGSMTAGAVALATTPSVLSRAIARLEARLGSQLLRRTTRRLGLTDAGRLYLDQTHAAFALIDDAERAIQGQDRELGGRVRLSAPTSYGHYRLPPLLQRFAARYPQVRIELNVSNRNVDLVAEGFDAVIRLGAPPDSGLVARKLEDAALRLVASPDYLARAGMPQCIADLAQHTCLPFVMPSSGRFAPWLLRADGSDVDWLPASRIEISDDVRPWSRWPNPAWASARATASSWTSASRVVRWWKCCRTPLAARVRFRCCTHRIGACHRPRAR